MVPIIMSKSPRRKTPINATLRPVEICNFQTNGSGVNQIRISIAIPYAGGKIVFKGSLAQCPRSLGFQFFEKGMRRKEVKRILSKIQEIFKEMIPYTSDKVSARSQFPPN